MKLLDARGLFALLLLVAPAAAADNTEHGRQVFEQCAACHTLDDKNNDPGPNLKGLFGRKIATVQGFVYSPAMRRGNFEWTAEKLNAYLADPQALLRGNKMPFAGMPDAQDRADLIAYLKEATK